MAAQPESCIVRKTTPVQERSEPVASGNTGVPNERSAVGVDVEEGIEEFLAADFPLTGRSSVRAGPSVACRAGGEAAHQAVFVWLGIA